MNFLYQIINIVYNKSKSVLLDVLMITSEFLRTFGFVLR